MERIRIGSDNTFALIVGIDDYAGGDDWKLNNPANEACRMVQWLLDLGVPAHRISCFITGGEARGEGLIDANDHKVQCKEPDGEAIRGAIRNPDYSDRIDNSNLIFYWAGHGQLGSNMEQLLNDRDYAKGDQQVFDLDDVSRALRSDNWAHFKTQILLINACAGHVSNNDHNFNKRQFEGLGDTKWKWVAHRQFILCAAPPGVKAADGSEKEVSPFFQKIYNFLKNEITHRSSISEDQFCQDIYEIIKRLNPPPRIYWSNFRGEKILFDPHEPLYNFIWEKLNNFDERLGKYNEINAKWMNGLGESKDLFQMVGSFRGAAENHPKRVSYTKLGHLVDFFLHVIAEFERWDIYDEMKKLVKDQNDLTVPFLVEAYECVVRERMKPEPPFIVSVTLTTTQPSLEFKWYLHHKNFELFSDGTWWPEKNELDVTRNNELDFTWIIDTLYRNDLEKFLYDQAEEDVTFRFYLNNEHLIKIPIHDLDDPRFRQVKLKLAHKSSVIVASFERANRESLSDAGRWKKQCEKISKLKESEVSFGAVSVGLEDSDLIDEISRYHWIALDGVPTVETLGKVIELGTPFIVWPYKDDAGWDKCREALQEMKFSETLPNAHIHFREFRKKHKGLGLVVFWDDAKRNPIPPQEKLAEMK